VDGVDDAVLARDVSNLTFNVTAEEVRIDLELSHRAVDGRLRSVSALATVNLRN